MPIVAITGLAAEAKIARRGGWRAVAAGGDAARTEAAIARVLAEGASGLVSFGIAGGLEPSLRPGSLIVPDTVCDEAGLRCAVDAEWRQRVVARLRQAGLACTTGDILGCAAIAATPERKRALRQSTQAAALDLESHLVAQAATRGRVPFLVLRALADPAERLLPPAALIGLSADGKPAVWPVLMSLARRPAQLGALLELAGDTRRALAALRAAARALAAG
jgi:adenosylhomocysteine nucleosidase